MLSWIFMLAIAGISAYWAKVKGYNPYAWFFGGSLIGLIVLAFWPNIADVAEEKKDKLATRGNVIAICMAVAFFTWGFAQGFLANQ